MEVRGLTQGPQKNRLRRATNSEKKGLFFYLTFDGQPLKNTSAATSQNFLHYPERDRTEGWVHFSTTSDQYESVTRQTQLNFKTHPIPVSEHFPSGLGLLEEKQGPSSLWGSDRSYGSRNR